MVLTVVVQTQVGKEFPDMRQSERERKFMRVGDAVRTVGQLKGEPTLNRSPPTCCNFVSRTRQRMCHLDWGSPPPCGQTGCDKPHSIRKDQWAICGRGCSRQGPGHSAPLCVMSRCDGDRTVNEGEDPCCGS